MSDEPTYLHFDRMTWPNPHDPQRVEWTLRYGTPDRAQLLAAASMIAAYKQLVFDSQRARNEKISALRRMLDHSGEAGSALPE